MPVITHDRPDPKYYTNIVQYDNGDWASDPLPIDDTIVYPSKGGYSAAGVKTPGLRTKVSNRVATSAKILIQKYAPNDLQRNSLYILTTQTSGTAWTNAKAMMDWVAAVNAFRDSQIATVVTLNFNQLVVYIVPIEASWPTPPAGLTPVRPAMIGSTTYTLRNA